MALRKRSEIEPEFKWKIEDLCASDEAFEKDYQKLMEELGKPSPYEGHLEDSDELLYEALTTMDGMEQEVERLYVYANEKFYEDMGNSTYQGMAGRMASAMSQFGAKYSFVEPELLAFSKEHLEALSKAQGKMALFQQYFRNLLREKPHILSGAMEAVLAAASEATSASSDIFASFNNADLRFGDALDSKNEAHSVTHGTFSVLMESEDRVLRKNAFASVYAAYGAYANTLAAMYNANLKQDYFYAKTRNYNTSMERHLSASNIPVEVYQGLIDTVNQNLSLMHRYVSLRKKVLGLSDLHIYDVYAPLVKDVDMKISFEEAKQMVLEGLAPLGSAYAKIFREGCESGWIDVYENEGKRSGAFSWGAYGTHPYVFLNYQENLNNVFTLAHEMGHAIHTYHSNKNQPHLYSGYRIFVAEVASTTNESLLIQHLLKKTTKKKEKLYLLNYFLEQFKSTLFRQTMFAEFEMITHGLVQQGETLTKEELCKIYHELNEKYFGKDMILDEEIDLEWARIPHFYTPFYVYQYATGFSAAVAISKKILAEGEPAVAGYMDFLSSGSSDYPIEVLKKAGVDMAKKDAVEAAMKVFEGLLDEFEEVYEMEE